MSRNDNKAGYFEFPSRHTLSLMGRVLFNCNRIFNGFGFININNNNDYNIFFNK